MTCWRNRPRSKVASIGTAGNLVLRRHEYVDEGTRPCRSRYNDLGRPRGLRSSGAKPDVMSNERAAEFAQCGSTGHRSRHGRWRDRSATRRACPGALNKHVVSHIGVLPGPGVRVVASSTGIVRGCRHSRTARTSRRPRFDQSTVGDLPRHSAVDEQRHASSPRSKSSSPASTKPSPTSSASRPTSSDTSSDVFRAAITGALLNQRPSLEAKPEPAAGAAAAIIGSADGSGPRLANCADVVRGGSPRPAWRLPILRGARALITCRPDSRQTTSITFEACLQA